MEEKYIVIAFTLKGKVIRSFDHYPTCKEVEESIVDEVISYEVHY